MSNRLKIFFCDFYFYAVFLSVFFLTEIRNTFSLSDGVMSMFPFAVISSLIAVTLLRNMLSKNENKKDKTIVVVCHVESRKPYRFLSFNVGVSLISLLVISSLFYSGFNDLSLLFFLLKSILLYLIVSPHINFAIKRTVTRSSC